MKQFGTVLVFRQGVSRAEAENALIRLRGILDPAYLPHVATNETPEDRIAASVQSFNPDHGGPVWYIP